jgi:hypothetical protein
MAPVAKEPQKPFVAPPAPEVVPANRNRPIGLDAEAFLPVSYSIVSFVLGNF